MGFPGGKSGSGVYQRIISQMPPHEVYVEPFLGGGDAISFDSIAGRGYARCMTWRLSTSAELVPLVVGHYSRRGPARPGRRLGGVGAPLYLSSEAGSAWIAVWQLGRAWHAAWREYPSWWVSLFRRAPDDPLKASALVADATARMVALRPGLAYTAVDLRRVRPTRKPGYCFVKAGWVPHCSTRPFKRCRSLLILRFDGGC